MNQESSFGDFDPAGELSQARKNLEATRAALDTDKYRQARPEMCGPLLSEAGIKIENAAGILERNPELRGGDSFTAFEMCLLVAFRNMQLALRDPAVAIGTPFWKEQVERGKAGAEKRWGDRDALNSLYAEYAGRRDGLGDLSKPSDIYNDFIGDCDIKHIPPPKEKRFRDQLNIVRIELGLKKAKKRAR